MAHHLTPHRLAGLTKDYGAVDWSAPDPYVTRIVRNPPQELLDEAARQDAALNTDEAIRDAVFDEIRDALKKIALGLLTGFAVVMLACAVSLALYWGFGK